MELRYGCSICAGCPPSRLGLRNVEGEKAFGTFSDELIAGACYLPQGILGSQWKLRNQHYLYSAQEGASILLVPPNEGRFGSAVLCPD
jgi:hypothetical protein